MKTQYFTIMSLNRFEFGEQHVTQLILFESKYLFSIIFFYFHKSVSHQDRFHTHAFEAISIRIFGDYIEEFLNNNIITSAKRSRNRIIYIPKDEFHRITKSDGCLTMIIAGSWEQTWQESIDNKIVTYAWNRNIQI